MDIKPINIVVAARRTIEATICQTETEPFRKRAGIANGAENGMIEAAIDAVLSGEYIEE